MKASSYVVVKGTFGEDDEEIDDEEDFDEESGWLAVLKIPTTTCGEDYSNSDWGNPMWAVKKKEVFVMAKKKKGGRK